MVFPIEFIIKGVDVCDSNMKELRVIKLYYNAISSNFKTRHVKELEWQQNIVIPLYFYSMLVFTLSRR